MTIQLSKKVAKKVKEVARELGYTEDEVVNFILSWYFEDCEKDE
jgi:predicted transcriptional regulator